MNAPVIHSVQPKPNVFLSSTFSSVYDLWTPLQYRLTKEGPTTVPWIVLNQKEKQEKVNYTMDSF